ncbi:5-guanidino-2-oxopentanoate decarboxylase [Sulfitobacter albidus]|uniref:5-guanidino-2-oxopentanoate decarboxylase n=1 Tax=Sulfitobacter albidus TaxID=2829501 RepID=A0A975JFR6_9RHOB|nr:5-guanidino-2-oxopentanoate decarboxylase [Sulfitobacter albidus]QUJ77175.1 5-guanidino-2-oxopentanoate decarboxylase [Sulfitobacter albidus]
MADPTERPLGAQISHMLRARGVDTIFGIPGVHNQEMYRGIEEAGITHVLARHEQGAGFMADGYARASGKPGVAYVITGPGLCNIMTPMGQAYSDSVPMLVISSCLDETAARRGQLHQMKDQRAAAETVCDWSEEARTAEAAYTLVDRAFAEFKTARARPKHIQVPIAALEAQAPPPPTASQTDMLGPPEADPAAVRRIAEALSRARRPVFVLGGGAVEGGSLWPRLMVATGAASFTTYAGRGCVPPGTPLHFGSWLARPDCTRVFAAADLVVVVGSELAEVDLWKPHLGHDCAMIRVDIDPAQLGGDGHPDSHQHRGDAVATFEAVTAALDGHMPTSDWTQEEIAKIRAGWRAELDAERPGLLPVIDALQSAVPEEAMIYSDMTQIAYAAKEVWDMARPGHWHHPYGFGTLGYATPAAIGGAIARPGLPTMALIGDYGFHYTLQELGVAVELGLPLPIVVWDNAKLGEIEDSMVRAQIAPNAVVARNPDFCALARAFGARAVAPGSLNEMRDAVRAAFAAQGPTLIYLTPAILR